MFVVYRGAGGLAPVFGVFFALLVNVLTYKILGDTYYAEHRWPKLAVLLMSGLACLVAGILLKRKRKRDAPREQQLIDSVSSKAGYGTVKHILFAGSRDHLMYVPLQYWCIPYFAGAIVYVWLSMYSPARAATVAAQRSSPLASVAAEPVSEVERAARQVKNSILYYCQHQTGTIKSKEAIAAMAAVVGERCLDAAGEIPVRTHTHIPGQRVFSDRVNVLLTGDQSDDLAAIPAHSIYGTIRDQLAGTRFQNHFPKLDDVFESFAGGVGKTEDWGKVPLSVPAKYYPEKLPLRFAFDTRESIDYAMKPFRSDKMMHLRVCVLAMAMMLKDEYLDEPLDPAIALALTFETINGMAKTVPMSTKPIDTPTREMIVAQRKVLGRSTNTIELMGSKPR